MRYLLVLFLCSCDAVERTEVQAWPAEGPDGALRALSVDLTVGDVTVRARPEPGGEIRATRHIRGPAGAVRVEEDRFGGTFAMRGECAVLANCRVDLEVEVPAGTSLSLRTGSGVVSLEGPLGDVEVDVGDGAVDAALESVGQLGVRVGWGDVVVEDRAVPAELAVAVARGDVSLAVPGGAYDLELDAFAGVELAGLARSPDGPRVHVQTRSGRVEVRGFDAEHTSAPMSSPEIRGPL